MVLPSAMALFRLGAAGQLDAAASGDIGRYVGDDAGTAAANAEIGGAGDIGGDETGITCF